MFDQIKTIIIFSLLLRAKVKSFAIRRIKMR